MSAKFILMVALLFAKTADATIINLTSAEKAWLHNHPTIRYAIDPHWRPIEYSENSTPAGLTISYLRKIANAAGVELEFVETPSWEESISLLIRGDVDLLPGVPDFELPSTMTDRIELSSPYFISSTIAVTNAKNGILSNFDDLSDGDVVAIRRGGAYESWMQKHHPEILLKRFNSTQEALDAVASGNATMALGPESILRPLIRQQLGKSLYVAGVMRVLPLALRIGTNSSELELKSIIQKALLTITAEESDQIQEQWIADADYDQPSTSSVVKYYGSRIAAILVIFLLMAIALIQMWRARAAVAEIAKQRAAFLSIMAHEIRNPLNYILSSIELANTQTDPEKMREYIDIATRGCESLAVLLENALDYSKIAGVGVSIEARPALISEILSSFVPIMKIAAERKGLRLNVIISDNADGPLFIDEVRIKQVLCNIVSNSIKFTEFGSVNLFVECDTKCNSENILFRIVDTGIGIKKLDMGNIFKPFFQVEGSNKNNVGSGLGLAICSEIVRAMRGEITVDSTLHEGTTTTIRIPAERATEFAKKSDQREVEQVRGDLFALVVEDIELNQLAFGAQLEYLGIRAIIVGSGMDAITEINRGTFDLIFIDCNLPDMSGYDLAKYVRDSIVPNVSSTPIVGVSADVEVDHVRKCLECGMDGVLSKPIGLRKLSETIRILTGHKGEFADKIEDRIKLNDDEFFENLTRGAEIKRVMRHEVMQALRCAKYENREKFIFHVHRLKGVAMSFGFPEIVSIISGEVELVGDLRLSRKKLILIARIIDSR